MENTRETHFAAKARVSPIRFTNCHEHACAACPTHVCYCIWRKRVYVIANEGFGLGDGTGPAEESKRTKHIQGWSRQIGLDTLFALHFFQINIFKETIFLSSLQNEDKNFFGINCLKVTVFIFSAKYAFIS